MSVLGKQGGRLAGQLLGEFLSAAGAKAGEAAFNYLTKPKESTPVAGGTMSQDQVDRIFGGDKKGSERVPKFTDENANPVTKFITEDPERTAKYVKKFTPGVAMTAGAALVAGGTALVQGLTQGEKPRSDYALPIGGPMDQLYMRQEGTAASIDQKLAADLMRTEAHAQLADRKFRHQMALQQHRQDAMVPRNQPMEGGVDVSRMLNGYASSLFGSTPRY